MGKKLDEMTITIVGVGHIGGSFALALKENQAVGKIVGMDKKEVISSSFFPIIFSFLQPQPRVLILP